VFGFHQLQVVFVAKKKKENQIFSKKEKGLLCITFENCDGSDSSLETLRVLGNTQSKHLTIIMKQQTELPKTASS
jgi:hypothetical protein